MSVATNEVRASDAGQGLGHGGTVMVIGLGNIGSHLVDHLARNPLIRRIVLIDHDCYDATNVLSQSITHAEIGKSKVWVQARRLRAINPKLQVEPVHAPIEHVALGLLRTADVVCACLDTRTSRLYVGVTWRLNVPYIDAGVEPGGLLARINVFVPGPDAPCKYCTLSLQDLAQQEQTYACTDIAAAAPTNAPAALGALAAALQAIECNKLLAGRHDQALIGRQLIIDAAFWQQYVSVIRRVPRCPFDHEVWHIEPLAVPPDQLTLADLFSLARASGGAHDVGVRAAGTQFVRALTCRDCGRRRVLLRLANRLRPAQRRCVCGGVRLALGTDVSDRLEAGDLSVADLTAPLSRLGFLSGDIVSLITAGAERHVELGAVPEADSNRRTEAGCNPGAGQVARLMTEPVT